MNSMMTNALISVKLDQWKVGYVWAKELIIISRLEAKFTVHCFIIHMLAGPFSGT